MHSVANVQLHWCSSKCAFGSIRIVHMHDFTSVGDVCMYFMAHRSLKPHKSLPVAETYIRSHRNDISERIRMRWRLCLAGLAGPSVPYTETFKLSLPCPTVQMQCALLGRGGGNKSFGMLYATSAGTQLALLWSVQTGVNFLCPYV